MGEMTMTTERQPDAPARGDSFWTSATGIVSALAALITALVGAAALFYTVRSGQPAEQTAKDPAGGLVGASTSSAAPATSRAQRPPAAGTSIYDDDFVIGNDSVDLDGGPPPISHPVGLGADIYSAGTTLEAMSGARMVKWTGSGDPGRDDCAARVTSLGERSVTVDVNTRVCLKTDGGRIVFFTVKSHAQGSAWTAHVVIWAAE
jgi:hypothetical protein